MATARYDNGSPANGTAAKKSAEAIEKTILQPTQLTIAKIMATFITLLPESPANLVSCDLSG